MSKTLICPRCKKNLHVDRDEYGWYEECMICGYTRDLNEVEPKEDKNISVVNAETSKPESRGIGKLYSHKGYKFIGYIDYHLFENPETTNWWGELTLNNDVPLDENDIFLIEFKDNRKSKCRLKKMVNEAAGWSQSSYVYYFNGLSPIE